MLNSSVMSSGILSSGILNDEIFWNMIFSRLLLAIIGMACGMTVSGGVFTVFTAVGIVPRFADKTRTAYKVITYENMIILGTLLGQFVSVYYDRLLKFRMFFGQNLIFSRIILIIYGLFTGCYIGCLALSIAEIYDSIPIMARRTHLKKGLGFVILSFAIGKLIGGLLFNSSFKPMS